MVSQTIPPFPTPNELRDLSDADWLKVIRKWAVQRMSAGLSELGFAAAREWKVGVPVFRRTTVDGISIVVVMRAKIKSRPGVLMKWFDLDIWFAVLGPREDEILDLLLGETGAAAKYVVSVGSIVRELHKTSPDRKYEEMLSKAAKFGWSGKVLADLKVAFDDAFDVTDREVLAKVSKKNWRSFYPGDHSALFGYLRHCNDARKKHVRSISMAASEKNRGRFEAAVVAAETASREFRRSAKSNQTDKKLLIEAADLLDRAVAEAKKLAASW